MWYVIFAQDVENSLEKRLSVRPKHLERLQQLQDEGRLLTAGPHASHRFRKSGTGRLYWLNRDRGVRLLS